MCSPHLGNVLILLEYVEKVSIRNFEQKISYTLIEYANKFTYSIKKYIYKLHTYNVKENAS